MASAAQRSERISLRVTPRAKKTIERAASYKEKTVTEYISNLVLSDAEAVVREQEVIRLNAEEWERFVKLLLDPPDPNAKLKAALKEAARVFVRDDK